MAVKGSKTKLKKSLSPQQISRARNEATKFIQARERSVVQYPTVPQKRVGRSKSLTSQAKVMRPEKVYYKGLKQNPATGKVKVTAFGVIYHSRPGASGTNGTRRVSGGSIARVMPKNASPKNQQRAQLQNELHQKAIRSAGVITGGQIIPKYKKMSSGRVIAQSGLVEKSKRKRGKR